MINGLNNVRDSDFVSPSPNKSIEGNNFIYLVKQLSKGETNEKRLFLETDTILHCNLMKGIRKKSYSKLMSYAVTKPQHKAPNFSELSDCGL